MAEFLVYNKEHWMDLPSKDQPEKTGYENVIDKINNSNYSSSAKTLALFNFIEKYNARSQKGDIIERRKDGIGMVGKELLSFALIKVPEKTYESAKQYAKSRLKEITKELDTPKLDYTEDAKIGVFKYAGEITREYAVKKEVPLLGLIDIDFVTVRGIVDRVDRKFKYYFDMSKIVLDGKKEATLTLFQFNSYLTEKI